MALYLSSGKPRRQVGKKRVYTIYKSEGLEVRTRKRKKRAAQPRVPLAAAGAPLERWSMDFMADQLVDGRRFRIFTVVDHFDRSRQSRRGFGKGWCEGRTAESDHRR